MTKAKQHLPSPEEIERAINASSSMTIDTYNSYGYDLIMPHSKALEIFNSKHKKNTHSSKAKPEIGEYWQKFLHVKTVSEFREVLGKDTLIGKDGIHSINSINRSIISKKHMMANFDVLDNQGVVIKVVGYTLDSLHKHLKPKK